MRIFSPDWLSRRVSYARSYADKETPDMMELHEKTWKN
jgi:hypothetical protein